MVKFKDIPLERDQYNVHWLRGEIHHVWMQERPSYCDRGHYIAHVEPAPNAGIKYTIDTQDAWPRYFMDFDRMIDEMRDWIKWREKAE